MSYATQSQLAQDQDFINRCNSCASQEIDSDPNINPLAWVQQNVWALAAAPGFDAAYASALAAGLARPGWDESVITDLMILSAVQALLAVNPPGT
jgi:hypothetical protein